MGHHTSTATPNRPLTTTPPPWGSPVFAAVRECGRRTRRFRIRQQISFQNFYVHSPRRALVSPHNRKQKAAPVDPGVAAPGGGRPNQPPPRKGKEAARMSTLPLPGIQLPGVREFDDWQPHYPVPYRAVVGTDRRVTDHPVRVSPSAVQWADGSIDDGRIGSPSVYVFELGDLNPLNSDQARELASALLEAAAEIDEWAGR